MASVSRRSALKALRTCQSSRHVMRTYASKPEEDRQTISSEKNSPYVVGTPIFPPPRDPFASPPPSSLLPPDERAKNKPKRQYSDTQISLIKGIANLVGYNSKATTAIRETRRMMGGIVEAVERDAEFWYGECQLPPTYQSFFQIHLLYVFILMPRLRALPASIPQHPHPIPEPAEPSEPHDAPSSPASASSSTSVAASSSSSSSIFTKPAYERYNAELINIFFELAETQMRRVLGRGERERVVTKYMKEMASQYRGANAGLDYAIGLSMSSNPEEESQADAELASWVWRNVFASKGLGPPSPEFVAHDEVEAYAVTELDMVEQLESVVRFIRREMKRFDGISDRDVFDGNIGKWGPVTERDSSLTDTL